MICLFDFYEYYFTTMGVEFQGFPYVEKICDALENFICGNHTKKNLVITICPRTFKTWIVSRVFPAWYMSQIYPDAETILTSATDRLAVDNAMAVNRILSQDFIKKISKCTITDEKNTQSYFLTGQGGSVYAAGMGGTITGFGAGKTREEFGGAVIIDDPLKAADAKSPTMVKNCIEYYTGVLKSRRNNVNTTPIILIMQRLNQNDLAGWVLKNEPDDWEHISFPAIDDEGNILNPLTMNLRELLNLKEVDPFTFYSQYQQTPIAPGGNLIKQEWWVVYGEDDAPTPYEGYIFITADTAFKSHDDSDASVIQIWQACKSGLYLLDGVYGRWEFPELLRNASIVWEFWRAKGAREFFVEDKASGTPLVQSLQLAGVPASGWSPQEYDFSEDKVGRVRDSAFFVHGGNVKLPAGDVYAGGHYLKDCAAMLMEESLAFQADMSHPHDDHVDAFTMAVSIYKSML